MQFNPLQHTIDEPEGIPLDTVVLVHGFPDSPALWAATVTHLVRNQYRVLRIALPGFESESSEDPECTFDTVVERLYATLVFTGSVGKTLLGHDWGAIFSYMLLHRYPKAARRFVALEVGAGPRSVLLIAFVLAYQGVLNVISRLGPRLGDPCMRAFCTLFPRPAYAGAMTPKAHHGWLYRQAWREGAAFGPWHTYYRNVIAQWEPSPDLCFLFIFGRDGAKALQFHDEAWTTRVEKKAFSSTFVGLPGRHWFFLEHPDKFWRVLDDFLMDSSM